MYGYNMTIKVLQSAEVAPGTLGIMNLSVRSIASDLPYWMGTM